MNAETLDEYTLWIEPKGSAHDTLKSTIVGLANVVGAPVFEPHVTLVGGIHLHQKEIMNAMKELAHGTGPIILTFNSIFATEAFYKSLGLECNENDQLNNLRLAAAQAFSIPLSGKAHLSLLYSNASQEIKTDLIRTLPSDILASATFTAHSISLWQAKGTADQWKKVTEVELFQA
ncbi:MAG: hypothetical protein V4481_02715 [Patescibacteria group bacterium]